MCTTHTYANSEKKSCKINQFLFLKQPLTACSFVPQKDLSREFSDEPRIRWRWLFFTTKRQTAKYLRSSLAVLVFYHQLRQEVWSSNEEGYSIHRNLGTTLKQVVRRSMLIWSQFCLQPIAHLLIGQCPKMVLKWVAQTCIQFATCFWVRITIRSLPFT